MISDFTGRRPLPLRDYVVSIDRVVLCRETTRQKFGDSLCDGTRPIKIWTRLVFFVIILLNMEMPNC